MRHEMHLGVGPAQFRIGCDWAAPLALLRSLYAAYPQTSARVPDFTVRLEATRPWRRFIRPSIAIKGDYNLPDAAPVSLPHALLAAEMAMNLQMALGWRRHLLLHASAVEKDGRALVMTGESGSGKSTLSALLGERGWRFLGDEFVLLDVVTGEVAPFPRLVSLKNAAIDAMVAEVSEARFGPMLLSTPKGDIRHLIPRDDAIAAMHVPAKPALLLFPTFGLPKAVRDMGKAEVFVRLTQASTNYVGLGESGFAALTRFVETVPVRAVDFASTKDALELVDSLWAECAL